MRFDTLLRTLVIKGASDIHLQANSPPFLRINGEITASNLENLSSKNIEKFVYSLMNREQRQRFEKEHRIRLIYSIPEICRFRINVFQKQGLIGAAIRVIPLEIPTINDLELPNIFKEMTSWSQGLILVTGPTGSGKSTTLAAIIDHINTTRKAHIETIENPIEFLHPNKSCLVNQRCLVSDSESFSEAIDDILQEDPDIILVEEMNDSETVLGVIKAVEAGYLVFSTLHAYDAVEAIDRIINMFHPSKRTERPRLPSQDIPPPALGRGNVSLPLDPQVNMFPSEPPEQKPRIREQISRILRGVTYQTLLRKKNGSGQIAAFEIITVDSHIKNLINEKKTQEIYSVLQKSDKEENRLLSQSIEKLYEKNIISIEEAKRKMR
jgi:twitching motility protein PilT